MCIVRILCILCLVAGVVGGGKEGKSATSWAFLLGGSLGGTFFRRV